jgi:hypothetical protein
VLVPYSMLLPSPAAAGAAAAAAAAAGVARAGVGYNQEAKQEEQKQEQEARSEMSRGGASSSDVFLALAFAHIRIESCVLAPSPLLNRSFAACRIASGGVGFTVASKVRGPMSCCAGGGACPLSVPGVSSVSGVGIRCSNRAGEARALPALRGAGDLRSGAGGARGEDKTYWDEQGAGSRRGRRSSGWPRWW